MEKQPLKTLARIAVKYWNFTIFPQLGEFKGITKFLESFNYCLSSKCSVLQRALDSVSLCLILQCKHVQEVAERGKKGCWSFSCELFCMYLDGVRNGSGHELHRKRPGNKHKKKLLVKLSQSDFMFSVSDV